MGNMMINHGVLGRPILRQTHLKVSRQIGQPCEDPLQRPKPNPEAWQISRLPLFAFCMRSAFFCFLSACKPSIGLWLLACLLASFCCQCCCWRAAGRTLLLVREMCGDGVVAASPQLRQTHVFPRPAVTEVPTVHPP